MKETPTIPIDQIEIGPRFRKEYGDINQLAFSIKKNGLINYPAVGIAEHMKLPRETDRPYILLAGGRRMAALQFLDWKSVPVHIYDQPLSELDLRSIELAENFDRKDMDYKEELALKLEINRLQKEIHGEKIGRSKDAPGWSNADTAKLLKESPATLSVDLKLAEAIERFPELGLDQCKNKSEALKRLKNVGKIITNTEQAKAYSAKVGTSDKLFNKLSSSYIVGDCFEAFSKIPSNSMSLIEVDPPYAINLHKVKKDNECIGYNEIDASEYEAFMHTLFRECYRVMRDGSWLICWFAQDPWFQTIADLIRDAGFKMNLIPAIWTKSQGQTAQPETFLGNSYEAFFYARKGRGKIAKPGRSNIFSYNPVPHTKKYHPTQRPLDLMVDILSTFCGPGTSGFIPFLGSGVSLIAGHQCQMNLIGTDLSQQFKDGYILQLKEVLGHE